jgi:hypothetical protein
MTISYPVPPLEDVRLLAARKTLAELPNAEDIDRPWFWIGRLRVHLETLTAAWPAGVPGGLDHGQREVLGSVCSRLTRLARTAAHVASPPASSAGIAPISAPRTMGFMAGKGRPSRSARGRPDPATPISNQGRL